MRKRRLRRVLLRLLAVVVAVIAALLATVFTFDLGPSLREIAEREGTKYMERPMHIGHLSAKLTPGVFVVEDLLIEGLTPANRPFLKAKKIEVRLPWWSALSRKLVIESVTLTDWEMVVESWPGGRHSFPKVMPKNRRTGTGPSRFTTTLRYVLATRGQFTYDDHATPWSSVARNLTLQLHRSDVHQRLSRHRHDPRTGPSRFRRISRFASTCDRGSASTAGKCTSTGWISRATAPGPSAPAMSISAGGRNSSTSSNRASISRPRRKSSFMGKSSMSRASETLPGRFTSSRAGAS